MKHKNKKPNRKLAPMESDKSFQLRIAKMMRGRDSKSTLEPEIDARFSPNRASALILRNAKKGATRKKETVAKKPADAGTVHILDARGKTPIWQFTQGKYRIEVWKGNTSIMIVAVGDVKMTRGVLFEMPFKAFRSLFHWGMPIAEKGAK